MPSHYVNKCLPIRILGCLVVALVLIATPAYAVTIHESATLGTTGLVTGAIVSSNQFLGSRFSVSQSVNVNAIGGHMSLFGGVSFFGAIVGLSSPGALPSGSPFALGEVIASTTFNPGSPSSDFLTPLSVTLVPGDYALIFGSGLFGSSGFGLGAMTTNNPPLPGFSHFFWNNTSWQNFGFSSARFVVTGSIPEPSTMLLLASGLIGLGFIRQRSKAV